MRMGSRYAGSRSSGGRPPWHQGGSKPGNAGREAANESQRLTPSGCSRYTFVAAEVSVGRCPWSAPCAEQPRVRVPSEAQTRCFVSLALRGVALGKRPAALHRGQVAHTQLALRLLGGHCSQRVAFLKFAALWGGLADVPARSLLP